MNDQWAKTSGKYSTLAIYRVLERYTSKANRLKQKDIIDKVRMDYNLEVDRKTVSRTVDMLREFKRNGKKEFEIQWQAKRGAYMDTGASDEEVMLVTAIAIKKKVQFVYNNVDVNKKKVPRQSEAHPDGVYVVDPYAVISAQGRCYLVCNEGEDRFLRNFRIDKMSNMQILDEDILRLKEIKGYENGRSFNEKEYLKNFNYRMFTGEMLNVEFVIERDDKNEMAKIINIFWDELNHFEDLHMKKIADNKTRVSVKMPKFGAKVFARQFSDMCTLTSPQSLRNELQEEFKELQNRYK